MLKFGNRKQETGSRPVETLVTISYFLVSSAYYLCVAWAQVVYRRLVRSVQTRGLCADLGPRPFIPEYKYCALRTAKPDFTRLIVPYILRHFTAVNQLVIPIIHTANKNNNKVNYLKSYLLLIAVRSPA